MKHFLNIVAIFISHKLTIYLILGGVLYIINNFLLLVFQELLHMSDVFSIMLSFALVSILHFALHNVITFKRSSASLNYRIAGHLTVSILNYFVGVAVGIIVLKYIADSNLLATAASSSVTFLMGFTLLNRFVYKTIRKDR